MVAHLVDQRLFCSVQLIFLASINICTISTIFLVLLCTVQWKTLKKSVQIRVLTLLLPMKSSLHVPSVLGVSAAGDFPSAEPLVEMAMR